MTVDHGRSERGARRWFGQIFVERQLIVRSHGRTRYIQVSAAAQMIACGVVGAVVAWAGIASYGLISATDTIAGKNMVIDRSRQAYRTVLQQVGEHQEAMRAITRDLHDKQRVLRQLFEENEALRNDLVSTEEQLKSTEAERAKVADGRAALRRQMSLLEGEVRNISTENGSLSRHMNQLSSQLQSLEAANADLAALRSAQERRIQALESLLAGANAKAAQLQAELKTMSGQLARTGKERDDLIASNEDLRSQVKEIEGRLAAAESLHKRTIQQYAEKALSNILEVEQLVGRTGLKIENLLPQTPENAAPQVLRRRNGQGGPFIPFMLRQQESEAEDPSALESLEQTLSQRVDRLEQLRELVRALPLLEPLDDYTLMSGYGYRRDPFTGDAALHTGLDLAAPMRTEVFPAAAGTVAFAGWRSQYGRMVEIDHGFGIRTRYAHLHRTLVKEGDKVEPRGVIGLLGTSGRSTGPHVHYEVLVRGRTLDPAKFIKAGKHVLESKQP